MNIQEAISEMKKGKTVIRDEWKKKWGDTKPIGKGYDYTYHADGKNINGNWFRYVDLIADDWIIYLE